MEIAGQNLSSPMGFAVGVVIIGAILLLIWIAYKWLRRKYPQIGI